MALQPAAATPLAKRGTCAAIKFQQLVFTAPSQHHVNRLIIVRVHHWSVIIFSNAGIPVEDFVDRAVVPTSRVDRSAKRQGSCGRVNALDESIRAGHRAIETANSPL